MKRKPLPSQSLLDSLLSYDPETGVLSFKKRLPNTDASFGASERTLAAWNARYAEVPITNRVGDGYVCVTISGQKYPAHRIIWKMVHGADPLTIDHIDGDKTNNRLENLRNVSDLENQHNRKLNANNSSGVSGVRWVEARRRWISRIRSGGRLVVLGSFVSKDDAISARKMAERSLNYHENHGRKAGKVGV